MGLTPDGANRLFSSTGVHPIFGQLKTNEETAIQMAHQSPSDSNAMTVNADPRLSRGAVRGADSRGFQAG